MECEHSDHRKNFSSPQWEECLGAVERHIGAGGDDDVRLGPTRAPRPLRHLAIALDLDPLGNASVRSNMDEIAFWVYTKKAPCLMNFDNIIKRQYEALQNSKLCKSDRSVPEVVPCSNKKKRKLSLLDDDGESAKQLNVYFENSHCHQGYNSKSGTIESDINFNIKNASKVKSKGLKHQVSGHTSSGQNMVVTSTPIRRSLRRTQNGIAKDIQCNFDCNDLKQIHAVENSKQEIKSGQRDKRSLNKPITKHAVRKKIISTNNCQTEHEIIPNGHYEDMSDVSGFTANYIRSTKLHSGSKTNKNLMNKSSKALVKESRRGFQKNDTTMLVCVNKSVNATSEVPQSSVLNCSTDSSQNVLNLVTIKNSEKQLKLNKSTSQLKFVDIKTKSKENNTCSKLDDSIEIQNANPEFSSETKNTCVSRYPKRTRNYKMKDKSGVHSSPQSIIVTRSTLDKRKKTIKNTSDLSSAEPKENTDDSTLSKRRNTRITSYMLQRKEKNEVSVYSIPTEQTSSVRLNVASQPLDPLKKPKVKRMSSTKCGNKSVNRNSSVNHKDSVRERSGYTACFSESDDDDSEALRQRKFFC